MMTMVMETMGMM